MKNKTTYLHMSHLLLVLCFAQSITGSIGKCAETLKMRPGVCHNSDLGVGIMPSQNLHQNSQLTGEFPGTIDVGYDNKKKTHNEHQTGAIVSEHGKEQISIHWGNTIFFIYFVSVGHCVLHN